MNLYIMTRGRVGKQTTLAQLPKAWKEKTWLVCPESEKHDHQSILAPPYIDNYSRKFQWIMQGMEFGDFAYRHDENDKAVILDDDLVFSKKNADGKLITIRDPEELSPMFEQMEKLLDDYPLVGVHPRQMGQDAPEPFVENGRIICIQGINRALIGKVRVDQFPILADVVLNLTLLARGDGNVLLTTFFQDHGPCQAPGGCSIYRTAAMQRDAVNYLVDRFGPFVKGVERRVKTQWLQDSEGVRYDYRAQWKALHRAGAEFAALLDKGKGAHPDKEARGAAQAVE
jgi:hypothetical protein